jgi:hypothetical protein
MQYGSLTSAQQVMFVLKQKSFIREPTFVVWIEGFGDTTEYVMSIDTEIGLESLRGRGNLNIGRAIIELDNENGYFYSNGVSVIKPYARMKVWTGFDGINVPIFTGLVHEIKPIGTRNVVVMNCRDYMGYFFDTTVKGELNLSNTPKTIVEYLCSSIGVLSEIANNEENALSYDEIDIQKQKMLNALEKICDSIFCVAYFDENGIFRLVEREYLNPVDWRFDDDNITDCTLLGDTEIINDVTLEYRNGFFSKQFDQASINEYKSKSRQIRIPSLGSDFVSENLQGTIEKSLDYDLEGFKFTSSESASIIDTVHIRMKGTEAHGYVSVKIYTDSNGVPGNLLGASNMKASGNLGDEFAWEIFCFDIPIRIAPSTNYWCIVDTSLVTSGTIYVQTNNFQAAGKHAYYNSSWYTEGNRHILHVVRGSNQSQRLADDIVRFYKKPHERIKIVASAIPHLQLLDEVKVDIEKMEIAGRYAIERRKHFLTTETYTTMDTLRKVG